MTPRDKEDLMQPLAHISKNRSIHTLGYPIIIGRDLCPYIVTYLNAMTKNKKVLIVYDKNLFFYAEKIKEAFSLSGHYEFFSLGVFGGKINKSIDAALSVIDFLEEQNFARDSSIIALGGGVIGDMVGFAAATYLRGINLIHVPSTVTAMVDSSIGGKVAVNHKNTINAIGTYYHPILNIIDMSLLDSLPVREYLAGMAEVIKCAFIHDHAYYTFLLDGVGAILNHDEEMCFHVLKTTAEIKIHYVKDDIHEGGKRLSLNYGHTLGHAIEVATGKHDEVLRHGEAVSVGMVGNAIIAESYFNNGTSLVDAYKKILSQYGLPVYLRAQEYGYDKSTLIKECMRNIMKDKKRKSGKVRFVLSSDMGTSMVVDNVPLTLVEEAFNRIIQ